jgi:hypothetical protein
MLTGCRASRPPAKVGSEQQAGSDPLRRRTENHDEFTCIDFTGIDFSGIAFTGICHSGFRDKRRTGTVDPRGRQRQRIRSVVAGGAA